MAKQEMSTTTHNPDRYMVDLRQILSQGRKRIGFLIGAGAPTAVRVDGNGHLSDQGEPLIPDVARLTEVVTEGLNQPDKKTISTLKDELISSAKEQKRPPNIEDLLTRVRRLAQAIGAEKIHGLDGSAYEKLGVRICERIGKIVSPCLPPEPNAFTELVSWIGGTHREHPVEIFTPNYDLLIEEAFERARRPYFDGFSGAHLPFFDPASITDDQLPARWSRLWKLHGSLGWDLRDGAIVRTGNRTATKLIYPDHLKYDEVTRQPYSALFERLRAFLTTPDSLLICCGFSFNDAHICAVLDEALTANAHTAIFAFQFRALPNENLAKKLALTHPNLSVYARDGAVIYSVEGLWEPGQPPSEEWQGIRQTFWKSGTIEESAEFLLGDFASLARFLALAHSSDVSPSASPLDESNSSNENTTPSATQSEMKNAHA